MREPSAGRRRPVEAVGWWGGRAFVLLSVAAALAPLPRYVSRLSRDDLVLWTAGVLWVVSLPLALLGVLRGLTGWRCRGGATRRSGGGRLLEKRRS